jgi:NADPH2:quinone reductase
MGHSYRAVMLQGQGGLEQLVDVDLPRQEPQAGQARVRVLVAGAGATDLTMRRSRYLFAPPYPFVPGYEMVGVVEAVGPGVTQVHVGQKVAALTVHSSFAEELVWNAAALVPVPDGLDDAQVVALILNYVTAHQMIHRVAKMHAGQTALIPGANGGVGTALLELLRLCNVRALAVCAPRHFDAVRALGGEPLSARGVDMAPAVKALVPGGVDVAFDILGGAGSATCVDATRKGGVVVGYGFMATNVQGKPSTVKVMQGFAALLVGARLRGRRGTFYGITGLYRKDPKPFHQDLPALLNLLAEKKVSPIIAHRLPFLAVRESQQLLEAGGVVGKIVLERQQVAHV